MQGSYLNGDCTQYYLELQRKWGFKHLPGESIPVNTNIGTLIVTIGGISENIDGILCYNGLRINNSDKYIQDTPILFIDKGLPVEVKQYNDDMKSGC